MSFKEWNRFLTQQQLYHLLPQRQLLSMFNHRRLENGMLDQARFGQLIQDYYLALLAIEQARTGPRLALGSLE
jgi:hypothetical protein